MNHVDESGSAKSDDMAPSDAQDVGSEPSPSDIEARMDRLRRMLLWVGDHDVARGLRSLTVGELSLQPLAIRTALQALRRKRDPVSFLGQPQYRPTIPLVAEAVSEACQDAAISALGEAADNPDRAQLLAAIEEIKDSFPTSTIALMLAFVSVTNMEAADLCDSILKSEAVFQVPAAFAQTGTDAPA
jgi:hypothetical protein